MKILRKYSSPLIMWFHVQEMKSNSLEKAVLNCSIINCNLLWMDILRKTLVKSVLVIHFYCTRGFLWRGKCIAQIITAQTCNEILLQVIDDSIVQLHSTVVCLIKKIAQISHSSTCMINHSVLFIGEKLEALPFRSHLDTHSGLDLTHFIKSGQAYPHVCCIFTTWNKK